MAELFAFIVSLIFLIWFGSTLNGIRKASEEAADQARRQTAILVRLGDRFAPQSEGELAARTLENADRYHCAACDLDFTGKKICPHCGRPMAPYE